MARFNASELEDFVRSRAPQIAEDIRKVADKAHNEADLVAEVEKILDRFDKNPDFDISLHLERERTLINGRADAVYNRFVIEYEPPRSLQKSNTARTNKHAIDQVKQYIDELERLDRHKKERLAGVALDGGYYIFCRHRDGRWFVDDPLPVDAHSTETFLRYLLSLSTELALTPENLERDFGANSNTARRVVPALYQALVQTENPKVNVLFKQWQRQFQEVSGYDPKGNQLNPVELGKLYAVRGRTIDLERLFFSIHTYYATFIKLLALQIGYYYLMPKLGSGLASSTDYDSEKLCKYLQNLESGGLFNQIGICNFLEGDFFGWYLDIWDETLDVALRRLIGDLANYSLVTLDVDPEETRDLLKQLYQNLMPRELRHALGEYYTPDWLAERLLNQLGYDGNPKTRILDPACGSGTFLVLAIKLIRKYAEEKMLSLPAVLDQVLENVVGFDLNPLAVISTRTNYLLALGDLLNYRKSNISIPVYLSDSILTPSEGMDLFTKDAFSFNTSVGRFTIPRVLVESHYIDRLAELLEESVHNQIDADSFESRLIQTFPLKRPDDDQAIDILSRLYDQLIGLERDGINGIWARIIKNAFAPLFQVKFDLIAGNPPWVNWESLPQDYRQETVPLWAEHKLFKHSGFDAILGKAKDDISILMTYVSLDKYLVNGGKLGFIITQSVFKSSGAGQGFRRFKLGNGIPLKVLHVDDMVNIKPFEGAANRTAMFIIEKGKPTSYPVQYSMWYKPDGGILVQEDLTLGEITRNKIATYRNYLAQPVDKTDHTSSWISGRFHSLEAIKKITGSSSYIAKAGVCTWLNGVYFLEKISDLPNGEVLLSNITERAKIKVDNTQVVMESDLIYPLLRGGEVKKWKAESSDYVLIPHLEGMKLKALPERQLSRQYPKTYTYLKHFEPYLRKRSGYHRYFKSSDPFYSIFDIGDYTFSEYKVVWANIASKIACAVISTKNDKVIIPQHIVTLVDFSDFREAHYFCAAMNSSAINYVVQSFSQKGGKSFGTPHILENVIIPYYNSNNEIHNELARLSQDAHTSVESGNGLELAEIETRIDELTCELWNLTEKEFEEIRASLEEIE